MRTKRGFTKIFALLLSVLMLFGMLPSSSVLFSAAAATTVRYEKYTPNQSGQIIEAGRYIIQSAKWNYVLTTSAYSGGSDRGLNASTDVTVNGNEITAPDAVVVTIAPVSGSSNLYTVKTDDGKYLSIADAQSNNKMNAYFVNTSTQVKALVYNDDEQGLVVGLANPTDSNNYCLNAHTANWFGGYSGGIEDDNLTPNRLYLYKEIVETTEDPTEPTNPTNPGSLPPKEGYHVAVSTEIIYEKYTPNKSGQYIEPGKYFIYNHSRNVVLSGQAATNGGITASQDFTITGDLMVAPEEYLVTIAAVPGQTNLYYLQTSYGNFVSIAASNNRNSASLVSASVPNHPQLRAVVNSNTDYVAIGHATSDYFLNAYSNPYAFGVYSQGLSNAQNQLTLYRETKVTTEVLVPDYPNEGAVGLQKEAEGIDFQNTGLAQVNLSLEAVAPFYTSGVDVLFITDVSNSMAWAAGGKLIPDSGQTSKLEDMQAAVSAFTDAIMEPNTGSTIESNNTVTFVTFGGWDPNRNSTSYNDYIDPTRRLITASPDPSAVKTAVNNIRMRKDDNGYYLSFDGSNPTLKNYGNTQYDYAFMEGYNAVGAIKQAYKNETGKEYDDSGREIFVIFISDGAPTNFNGYQYKKVTNQAATSYYSETDSNGGTATVYNSNNSTNQNYTQQSWYNFIQQNNHVWATKLFNLPKIAGMDTIGIDFLNGGFEVGSSQWIFTPGSNMDLGDVLSTLVQGETLDILTADNQAQLAKALADEAKEVSMLSSYVSTTDKLGAQYNLQMANYVINPLDGTHIPLSDYSVRPSITVSKSPTVHSGSTEGQVGTVIGDPVVIEKVTFNDEGTEAYSNLIDNGRTNIFTNGVIHAVNFSYNATNATVVYEDVEIPPESFHWNVSKLTEDQLTLSYYVNLDGAGDRTVEDGVYETNEFATITYKTHDGIEVSEDYEKPELEWENKITVIKKWTDADVSHDPITARIVYTAPNGAQEFVSETFTLSDENNWTADVKTTVPTLAANGTFSVTEAAVDGYKSISGELVVNTVTEVVDNKTITKHNLEISLYNSPVNETTVFEVTKSWADGEINDHADDPVEVELYCNNQPTGKTATLSAANHWTYTFLDLPLAVNGAKAVYSAHENTEIEDYISTPGVVENINASDIPAGAKILDDGSETGIVVWEDAQGYPHAMVPEYTQTITNEIDHNILHLRIDKKWGDNDLHEPVTLALGYRYQNGTEQSIKQGIVLSDENDWTVTLKLRKISEAGEYFITESDIPAGYQVKVGEFVYSNDSVAEVSVYNVKDTETAITAHKSWADGAENHAGEAVEVELYINGAASGRTASLSASNDWSYTFGGLAVNDENGNVYNYTVREKTQSMLYTVSYSAVSSEAGVVTVPGYELVYDGGANDVSVYENAAGSVIAAAPSYSQTVTNTPKTNVDTVELIVNKQWEDNLSSHGAIDCVVGYEAADGSVTVVSKSFTLSADTDWSRKIEVAQCDTETGRYLLLEPTVDGYEPVTGDLQIVDTTRTITAYVPANSLADGNEYVITDTAGSKSYVIGYTQQSSNSYPLTVMKTGFTHVIGEAKEGNTTHFEYFTEVPENAVWTYTNGALQSGNRRLSIDNGGASTVGATTTSNIYYSALNGNFGAYSGKIYSTVRTGTIIQRTRYYYLTVNNQQTLTSAGGTTSASNNYGTELRLFRKTSITVGSTTNSITATNIPKLGNQTIVIDYGLPVQVSVADYYAGLGVEPTFVGLGAPGAEAFSVTDKRPAGFSGNEAVYAHGTVSYADGKLTYTPTDMMMSEKEVIGAAFSLEAHGKTWYLYGSVTVVPATIMYYEDNFVTFTDTELNKWEVVTGANDGVYQGEDRPGFDQIVADLDADNVYGYDDANVNCTTYSNGTAHRVKVRNGDYAANGRKWPTATFTFTGTGFDLISVTSNQTGFIYVDVYTGTEAVGTKYDSYVVDTYYGYQRSRDGYIRHEWYWNGKWYVRNTIVQETEEIPEDQMLPANIQQADTKKTYVNYEINYTWTPSTDAGALYQIPVIKSPDLPYNTYTVVVTLSYATFFDHTAPINPATGRKDYTNGNYDFYLDAIRTYAPAEDYEGYNKEYYTKDGEGWPQFIELRKNIISAAEAVRGPKQISGAVFFDSIAQDKGEGSDLTDYVSYGPDNEVYLAPGQSISFCLLCENNGKAIDTVQIGAKKLTGETVELTATHSAGDPKSITIVASSDMYYNVGDGLDWSENVSDLITLTNTGKATVSITNVKITYKEIVMVLASFAPMSRRMIKLAASNAGAAYIAGMSECRHRYEYTVTTAPTETESGIVTARCADCGNSFEIVIPAVTADVYSVCGVQNATATEDGWVEFVWEDDGAIVTFRMVQPATGDAEVIVDDGLSADETDESFLARAYGNIRTIMRRLAEIFRSIIAFINSFFQ